MQRKALRIFIVLAVLSVCGMALVQGYWFDKAFSLRRESFTRKIVIALNNVGRRISEINSYQISSKNLVTQLSLNAYSVMVNQHVDPVILQELIKQEFSAQQLTTDFEYSIYDCTDSTLSYGAFVCMDDNCDPIVRKGNYFQLPSDDNYYFVVQLPDSVHFVLTGMEIWLFSSIVLFVVFVFFAYSLFFILRQKKLSELQADFVNNMTHEFQTPISSILLSGKTLIKEQVINQPEKVARYADLIYKEGTRLKRQVAQILDNTEGKRGKLKLEPISVHNLLDDFVKISNITSHDVSLVTEFNAERDTILADELHCANVFHNILENALKYSFEKASISIKTYNEDKCIVIIFSDKGKGIPKGQLKLIFQKFYRIPSKKIHATKGFGLGLFYVREVMLAHKGKVKINSVLGCGTDVILTFNLAKNNTRKRYAQDITY